MNRILALILLAAVLVRAEAQETRYVTDILQLGLYANRDVSGQPIRNLVSGTELTVLERIPNYARVRTPDGEEGWVRSLYLIDEKPAQLRVAELEARIESLEHELVEARVSRDAAQAEASRIVTEAELQLAAVEASTETLARLEAENAAYAERFELYRGALPWPWVAAALVVVLGAGFVAGYWWLDASIRRRHGGFRVY